MTIKTFSRLLIMVLSLVSGSLPVRAQESDRCSSAAPIMPGDTVSDAGPDVAAAHIDITEISISLSGGTLTVVFDLSDLPDTLTFNRAAQGMKEYEWEVAVDVDNGRSSGRGGFAVLPTAYHIVWASEERRNGTAPIGEILRSGVWGIDANGSASEFAGTSLEASPEADTITLASETDPQS